MLARTQFPLRLAYAMTFNKAQGQTLSRVVIDFTSGGAFAHGHLYVALSRVRHGDNLAAFVTDELAPLTTPHIVHLELLKEGDELEAALDDQQATIRDLACASRLGASPPLRGHFCGPVRRLAPGASQRRAPAASGRWPCGPQMTWDMELMTSRHPSYSLYANKHPHIKLRSRANLRRYVSNTSSKVIGAIMRTRENEQERERGVHAKSRAELRSLLRPKSLPPRQIYDAGLRVVGVVRHAKAL